MAIPRDPISPPRLPNLTGAFQTPQLAQQPGGQPQGGLDYTALFTSDPILQAALGQITAQNQQAQTALTAARQRALIEHGAIPDPGTLSSALTGNVGDDITDSTRQLAGQATEAGLSTLARLRRDYERQQEADVANLAGRGMLRSGAYRQHSTENLRNLQLGQYDAQQTLLDRLAGLWQGYQGQQADSASRAASATGDALTRALGQIDAGLVAAPAGPSPTPAHAPAPQQAAPPKPRLRLPHRISGNYQTARRPAPAVSGRRPLY